MRLADRCEARPESVTTNDTFIPHEVNLTFLASSKGYYDLSQSYSSSEGLLGSRNLVRGFMVLGWAEKPYCSEGPFWNSMVDEIYVYFETFLLIYD